MEKKNHCRRNSKRMAVMELVWCGQVIEASCSSNRSAPLIIRMQCLCVCVCVLSKQCVWMRALQIYMVVRHLRVACGHGGLQSERRLCVSSGHTECTVPLGWAVSLTSKHLRAAVYSTLYKLISVYSQNPEGGDEYLRASRYKIYPEASLLGFINSIWKSFF